jgi:hypothetical protein
MSSRVLRLVSMVALFLAASMPGGQTSGLASAGEEPGNQAASAPAAGEFPQPERAAALWEEGRKLFTAKQYAEGLRRLRASLDLAPDAARAASIQQYEKTATTNKEKAQKLRDRGWALQQRGDVYGARIPFKESLRFWPDPLLEQHVEALKSLKALEKTPRMLIADQQPCALLDASQTTIPEDFAISFTPGAMQSEMRTRTTSTVRADGSVVVSSIRQTRPREWGRRITQEATTHLAEAQVRQLFAAVTACEFFALQGEYRHQEVRMGIPTDLDVTANGKTRTVKTLGAFVGRFTYLVELFKGMTRGIVEAELRTMYGTPEKKR